MLQSPDLEETWWQSRAFLFFVISEFLFWCMYPNVFHTGTKFYQVLPRNASSFMNSSTLSREERSVDSASSTGLRISGGMKNFATSQWSSDHLALLQFSYHDGLLPFSCDSSSSLNQCLHELHRPSSVVFLMQSSGLLHLPAWSKSLHRFSWNAFTILST